MSNQLVSPLYYVYKLTFKSGKTYIGLHIQRKSNDNYVTSSSYYKKHPEDIIISRDILIFCKNEDQLSFMETWCILSDKAYNGQNNVNRNLGAFIHRMCGKNIGFKFSEKSKHKMSESQKAYAKAHPRTDEYKKKMSESCKRVVHTDTWRANQSKALMGHKLSDETKEKIRQKHLGRKLTEEQRKSFSKSASGTTWYNNGVFSIRVKNTENPPEGFTKGRLKKVNRQTQP